ncbi:FkbM family methyltransferase [Pedobacter endophyticus]|uniref:FkbM family methyltransferase n=1 Tax=Pedobacter endophyticus TaxID=2789740 RepID=A0A7U3SP55_9SPHI|nr:FkbM family methyltransferase [Pedobacter endophyticus]QPH38253.1 FkbM family methyltransferase [Pedobacter endophyticus]
MKPENSYKIIPANLMQLATKRNAKANLDPLLYGYQILLEKFNISRSGVIHLGGHIGEELPMYAALGFRNVVMVEPLPEEFKIMQTRIDDYNSTFISLSSFLGEEIRMKAHGVNCAISDESGLAKIYRTEISSLSSLTKPVKGQFSDILDSLAYGELSVPCKTLDQLIDELPNSWTNKDFSYLRMNIQGSELKALKGGERFLKSILLIDLEANTEMRYEDIPTRYDFDSYLNEHGFTPILSYSAGPAIANVLYLKSKLIPEHILSETND